MKKYILQHCWTNIPKADYIFIIHICIIIIIIIIILVVAPIGLWVTPRLVKVDIFMKY